MIRSMYLFDALISGVSMSGCGIEETEEDFKLLSELISVTVAGKGNGFKGFDMYLRDEWRVFIDSKQEVVLRMYRIYNYFEILSKLVLYNVEEYGYVDIPNGKDNVIKPEWLSMFPSLETLTINTASYVHDYKFQLKALMESITVMSPSITVNVKDGGNWAQKALNEDVSAEYDAIGWTIEYVEKERMLVIKSKSK